MSKQSNQLQGEMCRMVGEVVFTLHEEGGESKQIVIADALRTAARSELLVKAREAAARVLDR